MRTLKHNITNRLGRSGKDWLIQLPNIIGRLTTLWQLSDLQPVTNMNWSYVVKAAKQNNVPVVLKICCDKGLLANEFTVLRHFAGHGAIEVINFNVQYNALLLKQAIPGDSLKTLYPTQVENVMDYYANVVKQLSSLSIPSNSNYRHIRDWLTALERMNNTTIPQHLLDKAILLKNHLLATSNNESILHGDLHHDNVLKHGDQWLAIDPKGIRGELAFEAAAFDFVNLSEVNDVHDITDLYHNRIVKLAEKLALNPKRLLEWVFVRQILAAAWFIEDNGDPGQSLKMAHIVNHELN